MIPKEPESDIDRTPWVSVRISVPKNHRVLELRDTIEDAPRNLRWEAMGALLDLWVNTFIVAWADGDLSKWKGEDIEEMIAWKGKPGALIKGLREVGFIEAGDGLKIAGWLKHQKRALRDRLRYYEESGRKPPAPRRTPADDTDEIRARTKALREGRGKK